VARLYIKRVDRVAERLVDTPPTRRTCSFFFNAAIIVVAEH
jgi:hypothetical protein